MSNRDKTVVVITGCSSGIGKVTAKYLKDRFITVYPTARKEKDVEALKKEGFENAMKLDVTKPDEIKSVISNVLKKEGKIDVWFNNAGYGQMGAIEDVPTDALKKQFETNLFGLHECTRQIVPIMRKQGFGKIIQHSSVLGLVALPMRGAYNASKYAVEGLTDTLRLELMGSGGRYAKVSGIRYDDTLAVRSGPSTGYMKIGDLPPDATGVEILECRNRWCRIRYGNLVGWAYAKYLRSY